MQLNVAAQILTTSFAHFMKQGQREDIYSSSVIIFFPTLCYFILFLKYISEPTHVIYSTIQQSISTSYVEIHIFLMKD